MPGNAATLLQAHGARREIELVVHHQHFLGLDPEKAGEHLHRLPGKIHEGLRKKKPGAVAVLSDERLELRVLAQHDAVCLRKALHEPEAGIVARALVLFARVAEPNNEPYHEAVYFFSFFSPLSAALSPPLAAAGFSPFSPSAASPSFGSAACSVVGISDGATAAAAAAASSSSVTSCGTTTVATTGFSSFFSASSTPFGSLRSRAWTELPTERLPRSTSMNSGRSSGKQAMSISFRTSLTTPPWSFTPGDFSALVKCSGTSMCSFLFFCTRWKSTCWTCGLYGCMLTARSSTCSFAPPTSSVRIEAWKRSLRRL